MAKHRHLTRAAGKTNRGKKLGPQRRVDISKLPKRAREALTAYAKIIKALVDEESQIQCLLPEPIVEEAATKVRQTPAEVRKAMEQFQRYHSAHTNEHIANAFTPLPRDFRRIQETIQTSSGELQITKPPQRGIELSLITDPQERDRIEAFANTIFSLRKLRDDLLTLPDGLLHEAAEEHGCTEVWIRKSITKQRKHCKFYGEEDFVRAHTPKPVGRPKGRQSSPEVIDDIEKARRNRKWLSRDADGGYSEIDNVIEKRLIHSLVEQTHGPVHSQRTTYRIIKDYEERQAARVAVADEGDAAILQEHLPAIANRSKIRGPGERGQFDIRPLPVVVDNNGVESTVHAMLVVDDATGRITSWELVFTKFMDADGEKQTQNFDGQTSRATVARSCLEMQGRYRVLYADNGFQELKRYQHFMIFPGEV